MTDRRRNLFVLLLVAGLLVLSGVVIAAKTTRLGLDLKGGVSLIYQGKPTKQSKVTGDAINRAIDIMRKRVDQLGVAEPEIQRSGPDQIDVSLPDVKNADEAASQVGTTAQMWFYDWEGSVLGKDCKPHPDQQQVTGGQAAGSGVAGLSLFDAVTRAAKCPRTNTGKESSGDKLYLVDKQAKKVLAGPEETQLDLKRDASTKKIPFNADQIVTVPQGVVLVRAGIWEKFTKKLAQRGQDLSLQLGGGDASNQHFAISLDNELISVPQIDYKQYPNGIPSGGGSRISGGFTIESAQRLANLLKTGALPIKLQLISSSQVSATLGKQALHQGLIAGVAGFIVVALFLLAFYRILGLIAVGALLVYAVFFFALIKLIPITLTLPGIAGLILTIGVAADANIVIFERVKEEIRTGRSVPSAIAAGYKRGLSAIIDANVVTFMVAFILFILATAGVKGFAFVLGIGTLVSLFTAVLATQAALGTMGRSRLISHPAALGADPNAKNRWEHFDFMGASKWFFSFSGVILVIGALALGGKGLHFGIDFESGTRITAAYSKVTSEQKLRTVLDGQGLGDAKIQKVSNKALGNNAFQISTKTLAPPKLN